MATDEGIAKPSNRQADPAGLAMHQEPCVMGNRNVCLRCHAQKGQSLLTRQRSDKGQMVEFEAQVKGLCVERVPAVAALRVVGF